MYFFAKSGTHMYMMSFSSCDTLLLPFYCILSGLACSVCESYQYRSFWYTAFILSLLLTVMFLWLKSNGLILKIRLPMLQDPLSHFGLWASARVYDGVSTNYGIRFRKLRYSHQAIRSGQMKFILIPVRKSLAMSCEHMAPQTEPIVFIIWVWKSEHRFCVSHVRDGWGNWTFSPMIVAFWFPWKHRQGVGGIVWAIQRRGHRVGQGSMDGRWRCPCLHAGLVWCCPLLMWRHG